MTNPKTVIDTILTAPAESGKTTVYPVTLARYGLLELVNSPFTAPRENVRQYDYIDTIYVMTQPASELRGYTSSNIAELKQKAFDFADTLGPAETDDILLKVLEQLKLMQDVAPESTSEKDSSSKKAQTAGC